MFCAPEAYHAMPTPMTGGALCRAGQTRHRKTRIDVEHRGGIGMHTRPLTQSDVPAMWSINEQGLPGTGQVTEAEMAQLLNVATLARGAFSDDVLVGFVICLAPQADYGSLNYAWFNARYDEFIYVDRIAVSANSRNKGVGAALYQEVIASSTERLIPIAAEVNLNPPNPGSMRFHERFDFAEVGVLHHAEKSVTMLLREPSGK